MIKSLFAAVLSLVVSLANGSASVEASPEKSPSGELSVSQFKHVVTIPDVHGDANAFLASLYGAFNIVEPAREPHVTFEEFTALFAAAIDGEALEGVPLASPSVGPVAVIQLGDLVDRGPHSIRCMDIALKIEAVMGWSTTILQGNHELMRLELGDAYVHPDEMESVGLKGLQKAVSDRLGDVGLVMARLSRDRDMPLCHPMNPNTLFVHAGIDLPWLRAVIDSSEVCKINEKFLRDLKDQKTLAKWAEPDSPLWTRGFSTLTSWDDPFEGPCVDVIEPGQPAAVIMAMAETDGHLTSIIEHEWYIGGEGKNRRVLWSEIPEPDEVEAERCDSVESLGPEPAH